MKVIIRSLAKKTQNEFGFEPWIQGTERLKVALWQKRMFELLRFFCKVLNGVQYLFRMD